MISMLTDPFTLFDDWFSQAKKDGVIRPNAVALATSGKDGPPSLRMVLFKGLMNGKFLFYTNYKSRKANEIENNPQVSLLFYWDILHRQIIIEGGAEKIDSGISRDYFKTRPRDSQLSAWASPQGQSIESREFLLERFNEQERRFSNKEIPCPSFWGGYAVAPCYFEFWRGKEKRLHERLCFRLKENVWESEYLAP
ncbi:MAG: pyridoxamine 5'-phosphate oxidase [Halobacteriovoraceae bacterium]|nr:pyridoxamine 5'-phosphate oxidase [Halobacteriovoraceae bacterium]